MNKINGYTEDEVKSLVDFVSAGKRAGKTLSGLFASYAQKTGRAKGSVRNCYYALLRNTGDKRVKQILSGKNLKAGKILPFSERETDEILRKILTEKSHGVSIRRAVIKLAGGDDKLMLRYQNKYRNVLTKQPDRIEKILCECGGENKSDDARARLEEEINALYDKLAGNLREENRRLRALLKNFQGE